MNEVQHRSLEAQFAAVVPPPRLSRTRLLLWRLAWLALSLRPVQRIIEKHHAS